MLKMQKVFVVLEGQELEGVIDQQGRLQLIPDYEYFSIASEDPRLHFQHLGDSRDRGAGGRSRRVRRRVEKSGQGGKSCCFHHLAIDVREDLRRLAKQGKTWQQLVDHHLPPSVEESAESASHGPRPVRIRAESVASTEGLERPMLRQG